MRIGSLLLVLLITTWLPAAPTTRAVDESLALLNEAERAEGLPAALVADIRQTRRWLEALKGAEAGDVRPLHALIAEAPKPQQVWQQRATVTLLCNIGLPDVAEPLAMAQGERDELFRVSRTYQRLGQNDKATAVRQTAVARHPHGSPSDSSYVMVEWRRLAAQGDIDAAAGLAPMMGSSRYAYLLQGAAERVKKTDPAKAAALLERARSALHDNSGYVPAGSTVYKARSLAYLAKAYDEPAVRAKIAAEAVAAFGEVDPKIARTSLLDTPGAIFIADPAQGRLAFEHYKKIVVASGDPPVTVNSAFGIIAKQQAQAGDYAGCRETLVAVGFIGNLGDAMETAAVPQSVEQAKEFIDVFGSVVGGGSSADSGYARLARAYVRAGDMVAANKIAKPNSAVRVAVAEQLAAIDELDSALAELSDLVNPRLRSDAAARIVNARLDAGDLDGAKRVLEEPNAPASPERTAAGVRLAKACLEAQRFDDAAAFGANAEKHHREFIAKQLVRLDQLDAAVAMAGKRNDLNAILAEGWCRRGDFQKATALLTPSTPRPEQGLEPITETARLAMRTGDVTAVTQWARSLPKPAERSMALLIIARRNLYRIDAVSMEQLEQSNVYLLPAMR